MKMNKYFYLLSLTLLLSQCREKQVGAEDTVISSNIVIGISEQVDIGPKYMYISAKTLTSYSCGTATIEAEKITGKNQFSIQYKKVILPTYCTLGGPARSGITLGNLANGDYALELITPLGINKGIIRVDSTNISLIFDEIKGIEIPEPTIKRTLQ